MYSFPWLTLSGLGEHNLYLSGDGLVHRRREAGATEPSALELVKNWLGSRSIRVVRRGHTATPTVLPGCTRKMTGLCGSGPGNWCSGGESPGT